MVDIISNFLSTAVGFLWGTPLIVLVLGSGALFTIGTGFFQFRHFGYFCKETFGALFDKSQNEQGSGHVSASRQPLLPLAAQSVSVISAV